MAILFAEILFSCSLGYLCSLDLSTWIASLHKAATSVAGASRLILDGKSIPVQVYIETFINYELSAIEWWNFPEYSLKKGFAYSYFIKT